MSKITEIKYLRVSLKKRDKDDLIERFPDIWVMNGSYCIRKDRNCKISDTEAISKLALDDTYAEMEAKVNAHLKLGWVLNGGVTWNYVKEHSNLPYLADELLQTMVKYEMPKTTDLLGLFDNKASSDSESDEDS